MTYIKAWMSSKFSQIRPQTTELAALERQKKSPWTYNGENGVSTFSRLSLTRSFSYLQVTRTYISVWMSSNFGQIPLLTMELAVLERLKTRCRHFFSVAIDQIHFKFVGNEDIHNISNEFEFRSDWTTDYGVICPWTSKKYPHRLIMGKTVSPLCLGCLSTGAWGFVLKSLLYP